MDVLFSRLLSNYNWGFGWYLFQKFWFFIGYKHNLTCLSFKHDPLPNMGAHILSKKLSLFVTKV